MLSATQAVLGAVLLAPEKTLHIARQYLKPRDFHIEPERAIFQAACILADNGQTVSPHTIQTECRKAGIALDDEYITSLYNLASTAANIELDCKTAREDALSREIQGLIKNIDIHSCTRKTAVTLIEELTRALERSSDIGIISSLDSLVGLMKYRSEMERGNIKAAVLTGYSGLDDLLGGGLMAEGLYILAARPGVGKTTFALNIAGNVAAKGTAVLFISLEMSINQLNAKRMAMKTGVPAHAILNAAHLPESDMKKIADAAAVLADEPIYFNKSEGASVSDIRALAKSRKDIGLIIVDYLGLIQHSEGRTLYEKVTATSGALKRLARAVGAPVLCLAQLNREGEQAPSMAHLRDSGAIEQDADAVLLLHSQCERPKDETVPMQSRIILAKNRHGRTGTIMFDFYLRNGRFNEWR